MYGVHLTIILPNSHFKHIKLRKRENKLFETIEHGNTPCILYSYIIKIYNIRYAEHVHSDVHDYKTIKYAPTLLEFDGPSSHRCRTFSHDFPSEYVYRSQKIHRLILLIANICLLEKYILFIRNVLSGVLKYLKCL